MTFTNLTKCRCICKCSPIDALVGCCHVCSNYDNFNTVCTMLFAWFTLKPFHVILCLVILVNMSLFSYFSHEKLKDGGDNNSSEATKEDDVQSAVMGVSESTTE